MLRRSLDLITPTIELQLLQGSNDRQQLYIVKCHQKEGGSSVGIHNNTGQDTDILSSTVARHSVSAVQTLAPDVIAKRTKRHLDELEAGIR